MGTKQLKLRPSGFEKSADWKAAVRPSPTPKKSPTGALTAGVAAPSQYMSIRRLLSIFGLRSQNVIHMRRPVPLVPFASASTRLSPAGTLIVGEPFRPAATVPARPRSPAGFSGLAHRVWTPSGGASKSDCAWAVAADGRASATKSAARASAATADLVN